jgi:hypothetical protein
VRWPLISFPEGGPSTNFNHCLLKRSDCFGYVLGGSALAYKPEFSVLDNASMEYKNSLQVRERMKFGNKKTLDQLVSECVPIKDFHHSKGNALFYVKLVDYLWLFKG